MRRRAPERAALEFRLHQRHAVRQARQQHQRIEQARVVGGDDQAALVQDRRELVELDAGAAYRTHIGKVESEEAAGDAAPDTMADRVRQRQPQQRRQWCP